MLRLRLYIAADGPNSRLALENLTNLLEELQIVEIDLELVDVFEDPERALADRVFVTPTLLRLEPAPIRRAVGTLSAADRVRQILVP